MRSLLETQNTESKNVTYSLVAAIELSRPFCERNRVNSRSNLLIFTAIKKNQLAKCFSQAPFNKYIRIKFRNVCIILSIQFIPKCWKHYIYMMKWPIQKQSPRSETKTTALTICWMIQSTTLKLKGWKNKLVSKDIYWTREDLFF